MLNAEKFKEKISKFTNNGRDFSVNKRSNEIEICCASNCSECLFSISKGFSCACGVTNWLLSEYKEQLIKVSKLEYEILKWLENEGYKYIVRDRENNLFIFKDAPTKNRAYWVSKSGYNPISLFNNLFKFVQLSDEKPTSIKEVLNNCEVVEDDLRRNIKHDSKCSY